VPLSVKLEYIFFCNTSQRALLKLILFLAIVSFSCADDTFYQPSFGAESAMLIN